MNRIFIYALTLIIACATCMACGKSDDKMESPLPTEEENGTRMVMATYNIRVATESNNDPIAGWKPRAPHLINSIKKNGFELFGTQEGLKYQLDDIQANLPGFKYIGVGRDDGKTSGEYAAIFYDTTKFDLLDSGNFWLSETPEQVSKGWDAAYCRVCTWGKFPHKESVFTLVYFNLHMDHEGKQALRESARLSLVRIKAFPEKLPVMLSGDFNVDQTDESYTLINTSGVMHDSFLMATTRRFATPTFNNFDPDRVNNTPDGEPRRIDHIFLSPEFKVNEYEIINEYFFVDKPGGGFETRIPSDHYPVMIHVAF